MRATAAEKRERGKRELGTRDTALDSGGTFAGALIYYLKLEFSVSSRPITKLVSGEASYPTRERIFCVNTLK